MTRLASTVGTYALASALLLCPASSEGSVIGTCDNTNAPSGPDTNPASNGSCLKSVELIGNLLTIELSNTTPIAFGGFLTADAFFLPTGIDASLQSTTNAAFTLSQNPSVNPFDNQGFDFNWLLSSTNNTWAGGGNPSSGIAAGSSATFVLALSGNLAGLSETDILTSEALRFRGFVQGGSDKDLVTEGNPPNPLPEPTTLILLAGGLIAAAARRSFR